MPIRITGMNSGLDTESIITQLVSAQSAKKNSLIKAQTKLSWKMDAWKTLNSKIYGFYTNTLSDMRFSSAYTQKKTTVSNTSIASVISDGTAVDGVQTLKVNQLAKSGYLTGEELKDSNGKKANYKSSTKLSDIAGSGIAAGDSMSMTIKTNGKETQINMTGSSTIGDIINQLQSAGVNASFDEKNQRVFISAKSTGTAADFSLTANNEKGYTAMTALGINMLDDATKAEYEKISAMTDDEKNAYIEAQVTAAAKKANDAIGAANKKIDDNRKKIDDFFANTTDPYYVKDDMDTTEKLAERKKELEERKETLSKAVDGETEEEKAAREEQLKDVEAKIKDIDTLAGYAKNIDDANAELVKQTELVDNDNAKLREQAAAELEKKINMAKDALANGTASKEATRIKGQDAEIILNGAKFTSDTNTLKVNGMTITALTASAEEISLTTANDYDGVYDTIKKFIKGYNELINELDKLYNAESSKGYDPLLSEEKEAMTEKEIEEWEKKIKDSILRRDSTVNDVSQAMQQVMSSGFTVGGKTMYLSDFGINTLGYFTSADNEKHAFHIDGDKEDDNTSANEDVLKNMIANNPIAVTSFFQKLSAELYNTLTKKMSASSMSSIYKAYNDKQMKEEYDDYTTKIAEQETKLTEYSDKWYDKFGAMETALAKLSSKTSALSGLLG